MTTVSCFLSGIPAIDSETPLIDILSLSGTHDGHDFLFRILDYVLKVRERYLDSVECACQALEAPPALQQALELRGTAALTAILNTAKLDQECSFRLDGFADLAIASCLDPVCEDKTRFDFRTLACHVLLATWNGKSSLSPDSVRGCIRLAPRADSVAETRDAMDLLPARFREEPLPESQELSYLNASLRAFRQADLLAGEQELCRAAEVLRDSDLTGNEDILPGFKSIGMQLPDALAEALVEKVCVSIDAPASSSSTQTIGALNPAWKTKHVAVVWRALRSKLHIRDFTFVQVPDGLRRCSIDHETFQELEQVIQQHSPTMEEIDLALSVLLSLLNKFLDFKDHPMSQVLDWVECEVPFLKSLPSQLRGRTSQVVQAQHAEGKDKPRLL